MRVAGALVIIVQLLVHLRTPLVSTLRNLRNESAPSAFGPPLIGFEAVQYVLLVLFVLFTCSQMLGSSFVYGGPGTELDTATQIVRLHFTKLSLTGQPANAVSTKKRLESLIKRLHHACMMV